MTRMPWLSEFSRRYVAVLAWLKDNLATMSSQLAIEGQSPMRVAQQIVDSAIEGAMLVERI